MDLQRLNDPFPMEFIKFRAGSKGGGGTTQALAYIDARRVMERLVRSLLIANLIASPTTVFCPVERLENGIG